MGGGHVSRPDFGMPQPDAAYPLTEFYLLAQQALEKSGSFMLPALYAGLHAPARRIYREEAAGYLQLAAAPAEGLTRLLSPARMQLLYSSLQVQPDGAACNGWSGLAHSLPAASCGQAADAHARDSAAAPPPGGCQR